MASGTKNKGSKGSVKAARASVVAKKGAPWGTIAAVVAIVLLAGGIFGYAYTQIAAAKKFTVSEENKDPSVNIDGVVRKEYPAGQHVKGTQRVAYDQSPPFGGPHDEAWADCEGVVYPTAVRSENMVHALEHGSVWIAYNPDKIQGADLDKLKGRVEGQPFMMLSPFPGLDKPISMQSWGHQLKLDSADDPRVEQFIKSLKRNKYQNPEPNAACGPLGPGVFDPASPPPFAAEPPGPDAIPMDGKGTQQTPPGQQPVPPTGAPTAPASTPQAPPASQ
ncbi:Protein of unknown function [Actinokineospora alba]|uniref:DUF3105 domain-containing protein n=1 Tax=Actinokineospora alba TaxID=504798 RepID=A0A1H0HHB7_9PSEU|nr:DUF3105 domain-containing protein [Actinokineospora alba]TDP64887.1 uncharacterized protein DUF3105 [Actinokineospora alba]SDH48438.1 Protein of unknown function [Actinokineospora alba]SDO18490.1 Protein of unknown function [Actinokineospora alba]